MFLTPGARAHLRQAGPTGATGATGSAATGATGVSGPTGPAGTSVAPTRTVYLSGSGQYIPPTNVKALRVRMKGPGGSTAGSGFLSGGGAANAGSNTTFGSYTAYAGAVGTPSTSNKAAGGAVSTTVYGRVGRPGSYPVSPAYTLLLNRNTTAIGGMGGGGVPWDSDAPDNSGYGAGGASGALNAFDHQASGGGGEGGSLDILITAISVGYLYNVGAAGNPGVAGSAGHAGYRGGSGYIIVDEIY